MAAKKQAASGKPGLLSKAENAITTLVSGLPFVPGWMKFFFRPTESCKGEKGTLCSAATSLFVFYSCFSVLFLLVFGAYYLIAQGRAALPGVQSMPPFPTMAFNILVVETVTNFAGMCLVLSILFAAAKLLGGKGKFAQHCHCLSMAFCGMMAPVTVFTAAIFLLEGAALVFSQSPAYSSIAQLAAFVVAAPLALAALAFMLYGIYSFFRALGAVHAFSGLRTAAAAAIAIAIVAAINLAFEALFGQAIK
ncbi:Uncharacterised protein [uncultured archaeon]|nr:Uncharacterised protein [uncultured archaeon]